MTVSPLKKEINCPRNK